MQYGTGERGKLPKDVPQTTTYKASAGTKVLYVLCNGFFVAVVIYGVYLLSKMF